MELYELTARVLAEKIKNGEVSSEEATSAVLSRIERMEPSVNAYITVTAESALERAREIDAKQAKDKDIGPLCGVPMAIKDSIITRGIRTTAGSHILDNFIPPYNAHVIEKLTDAGAVFVGKANTDEFTMGSTCETSYFRPSRNPHNTGMVTGGSSGGPAAALAANDRCACGNPLLISLNRSDVEGDAGRRRIRQMVETYFGQGGFHLHFNIIDAAQLREAKAHPEQHADLLVRISGLSAQFVALDDRLQDALVERTDQGL